MREFVFQEPFEKTLLSDSTKIISAMSRVQGRQNKRRGRGKGRAGKVRRGKRRKRRERKED